jgi:DNA polymerase III epsilon subunit family exonuclease
MGFMNYRSIVSFDVETTGLWATDCQIIEIAAVRWENGAAVARFESLVNPGRPIDPASVKIHGITDAAVAGAPRIAEVLARFFAFAGELPLAAHNADFDLGFLAVECARANLPLPTAAVADTLGMARAAYPGLASYRLAALAEALGFPAGEYHRALADAETAGLLYQRAAEKLAGVPESAWSAVCDAAPPEPALAQALAQGTALGIAYGKYARRHRIVPRALFTVGRTTYLHAECSDGAARTFRLDWVRVERVAAVA